MSSLSSAPAAPTKRFPAPAPDPIPLRELLTEEQIRFIREHTTWAADYGLGEVIPRKALASSSLGSA